MFGMVLMLRFCMDFLVLHTTHLSLLQNLSQILRHILGKCVKDCMLLLYLCYTKLPFRQIQFKPYNKHLFQPRRICGTLEKLKIQSYYKSFTKIFFDYVFFGCKCYICTIWHFFSENLALNLFNDCITWSSFYWIADHIKFVWPTYSHSFLH